MKLLVVFAALVAAATAYSCGKPAIPPSVSRVVGGQEATPHSWPWQVSLQYRVGDGWFHSCGATLISPDWIMTAAHCYMKGSAYRALIGKHRLSNEEEEGAITVQIAKVFVHNDYDDHLTRNDIALMWLDHTIDLTDSIQPACLPRSGAILAHDTPCYVTGWGRLSTMGDGSDTLQQALLPIVEYKICKQPDWWSFLMTDKMVCAGGDGIKASCMGDSGGPLNCQNSEGVWEVHGAVSFGGSKCNEVKRPSVFTRISAYTKWINDILMMH